MKITIEITRGRKSRLDKLIEILQNGGVLSNDEFEEANLLAKQEVRRKRNAKQKPTSLWVKELYTPERKK